MKVVVLSQATQTGIQGFQSHFSWISNGSKKQFNYLYKFNVVLQSRKEDACKHLRWRVLLQNSPSCMFTGVLAAPIALEKTICTAFKFKGQIRQNTKILLGNAHVIKKCFC